MGLIPAAVFLMKAKMKMLACRDFGASFKCSLVVEWQKLIRAFHYVLRVALARKTPKIFTFSANCGVKLFFFFFLHLLLTPSHPQVLLARNSKQSSNGSCQINGTRHSATGAKSIAKAALVYYNQFFWFLCLLYWCIFPWSHRNSIGTGPVLLWWGIYYYIWS